MALMKEDQKKKLKKKYKKLDGDVKLIVFTQEMECHYCKHTRELIEEIAELSDKITVESYDFVSDKEEVKKYKIDKIPATVILGEKDHGIRFYGIPAGYEFVSFTDAIEFVSTGETDLSDETKAALSKLKDEVHVQVFVTLTCPFCPSAVEIAQKMAMESDLITADMIETSEFPHLTQKYDVMTVPKVIVNEDNQFEGTVPEIEFVENLFKALEK